MGATAKCAVGPGIHLFLGTKWYVDRQWTRREARQTPGHNFLENVIRFGA